ncbi:MAG: IS256 family transposase [Lachnospiraceae bacterium]|uniref:Mutator family transposase n=1 Tax=Candidatus Weimeria bifida TaxID=2599074 RepID=A0A6N7IZM0_9FIRM|nr:IS256 family transposase [Candidatus Weimeria bifida]RRF94374.1 MAG: IS256 family transposase [Lachnospiraceae bacterium]
MAQLNITLNQEEILQLLSENRDDAFKALLQNCLNSVLKAESTEQLKPDRYERSDDRTDSRNGSRERKLNTRIGRITLTVPRHRNQPFKTMIFENYSRSEAALVAGMAEMVVNGVSTRKVSKVVDPSVPWQRCQFHFSKNIADKAPKKYQSGLRTELTEMFNAKTEDEAVKIKDRIISDYSDVAEAAMQCLDEGFESSMTVMHLPSGMRKYYRTSNHIERINKELKRRSRVIGIFPNERSLIRLMGSALMELNEAYAVRKAAFSKATYQQLISSDIRSELKVIADNQRGMLVA